MFDRIINILVVESNEEDRSSLLDILRSPGHNIFVSTNSVDALTLLEEKKFTIIFCSLDLPGVTSKKLLADIHKKVGVQNATIIVTSSETEKLYASVNGTKQGAMDYLPKPFLPNLVNAKMAVYKKLFFKHKRINRLLESILPSQTLKEFRLYGKSSPKKRQNCAVLFTDFVNFTQLTKNSDPQELVKKLDFYFSKFDEIILKYKLEKIKTIGDAYMAVGGVTEKDPHPALRMALAANEIRNFMLNDMETLKAFQKDYWEIRIGIHIGDLVAGVVGKHKFSFDVWGDTVNIAARCEQNSTPGNINISGDFANAIKPYFDLSTRGKIILKNSGEIDMFYLEGIKPEYSLYNEGRVPNVELRKSSGLPLADFIGLRSFILTKLKAELNENLLYHSYKHTETVEAAVVKYGELEKLDEHELFLVRTAALFHDCGFLFRYDNNEELGVELLHYYGPRFGYQTGDLKTVEQIIMATGYGAVPNNLMQSVMCDADLDYLGRADYHVTAAKLFDEMALNGMNFSAQKRIEVQIDYLENHHEYYTNSAKNLRAPGKIKRIAELKTKLSQFKA
ncbi:MAG: response regulator [Crocinitomix sp.]|nr:response regulator [Crocinitomix sp.]